MWLPPLSEPPSLGDLLGDMAMDPARGLYAAAWPGTGRLVKVPEMFVGHYYDGGLKAGIEYKWIWMFMILNQSYTSYW